MLFAIYASDKEGAHAKREQLYDTHRAHLANAAKHNIAIIMSGPLTKDDATTAIGSLFVFDAPDRQTVEQFHHADPFWGVVWEKTSINLFIRKR